MVVDRRALDDVAFAAWGPADTEPHLLSPSRAHGGVLVLTRFWRDNQSVENGSAQWIHDLAHPDLGPTWTGIHAWPVSSSLTGRVVINDRSGDRVRWQQIEDGKPLADLDDTFDTSPDGTRGFQTDYVGRTISLADRARTTIRTLALPGTDPARDDAPIWLDASHAWMIGPHGVVALDLAHGTFGHAATGWQLELSHAPHPTSELRRPFATDVATGRDGPLALPGDAAFQALARDVADRSHTRILWWGPVKLDGALHRTAMLQDPDPRGDALFAALIELASDRVIAVTIDAVGFPHYQDPFPDSPPAWGTGLASEPTPPPHTIDFTAITVSSKWIHGSGETFAFTLAHDKPVVVSDSWTERENNGHGIDTSTGGDGFSDGRGPSLAHYKAHAMRFAISKPAHTAEALATGIHELPFQ